MTSEEIHYKIQISRLEDELEEMKKEHAKQIKTLQDKIKEMLSAVKE